MRYTESQLPRKLFGTAMIQARRHATTTHSLYLIRTRTLVCKRIDCSTALDAQLIRIVNDLQSLLGYASLMHDNHQRPFSTAYEKRLGIPQVCLGNDLF